MSGKRSGKKGKSRVSFVEVEKPKTRLDIMKAELEQMRRRDEEKERLHEEHRQQVCQMLIFMFYVLCYLYSRLFCLFFYSSSFYMYKNMRTFNLGTCRRA